MVSVRLRADSPACALFRQVFPAVQPPQFILLVSGVPLATLGDGQVSAQRIKEVLDFSQRLLVPAASSAASAPQQSTAAPHIMGYAAATPVQSNAQNITKEAEAQLQAYKQKRREEDEEKQRIKRQIKQDRIERRAADKARQESAVKAEREATRRAMSDKSSLLIRLPDDQTLRQSFAPTDTLAAVRKFIDAEFRLPYELSSVYPARLLTNDDATLASLELVPSGTLIVKVCLFFLISLIYLF